MMQNRIDPNAGFGSKMVIFRWNGMSLPATFHHLILLICRAFHLVLVLMSSSLQKGKLSFLANLFI